MSSRVRSSKVNVINALEVLAAVVILVMMIHIVFNGVLRAFFRMPIPFTLEIVQYWYLPVVALLGFVAAQHRGQHIAADFLFDLLPSLMKRYVLFLVLVVCALIAAGFAWFGFSEALHAMQTGRTAGSTTIPTWPVYFLVPAIFGSLTLQLGGSGVRALLHPEKDAHANESNYQSTIKPERKNA